MAWYDHAQGDSLTFALLRTIVPRTKFGLVLITNRDKTTRTEANLEDSLGRLLDGVDQSIKIKNHNLTILAHFFTSTNITTEILKNVTTYNYLQIPILIIGIIWM